ncbi:hypothetical protein AB1N83_012286 [Pleurotus pulmonarius]
MEFKQGSLVDTAMLTLRRYGAANARGHESTETYERASTSRLVWFIWWVAIGDGVQDERHQWSAVSGQPSTSTRGRRVLQLGDHPHDSTAHSSQQQQHQQRCRSAARLNGDTKLRMRHE